MSLNVYTSNRMENLVESLAVVLREPLASPFTPETIVVQSKGMQRWLAMELAGRLGIWANCRYPFPNKVVWELFKGTLTGLSDVSRFSPEVLTWRIMGMLPGFLEAPPFVPLHGYLTDDGDGLKRFQLAGKIADTFDQYTLYRPDLLLAWEGGEGDDWQGILWRALVASSRGEHRGRLKLDFAGRLAGRESARSGLPARMSVFGISYLPGYHLDILSEVAKYTEVNLFLLSPCREYWGDIVSARQMLRRPPEERGYLAQGNPLLGSLGKLGRDFSNMVLDGNALAAEVDLYRDPGEGRLLDGIQSDILNLRGAEGERARRLLDPQDRSVQIHACHSPIREVEVLYDNLLALLADGEGLAPRDIIVMTPDIEAYAPYISMVFGGCQDQARRIPFSIADRSLACEGEIAGALLKLIGLPGSRLSVTSVFDILESSPVAGRFGLDAGELETVRGWLEDTRIRWGADELHRKSLGLPAYRENSWRAGLDRLLLGYCMPEEGDRLFHGILPYDELEGNAAATLGKFAGFVRRIEGLVAGFTAPRTLGEWRLALGSLVADFIQADEELAPELATVNGVLQSLSEMEEQAVFGAEVGLPVIRAWISSRLGTAGKGQGFMTGEVTFCAMLPMRSIPFRVVCLIGMNDGVFPRQSRPPGFDLIARNPRPGDRSLRDEDRYLFLECLLSARQYLYLSYVGLSVKDNSAIPPSVLVSDFLDAVGAGFDCGGATPEGRLVTRHRLQPFSRKYFDGGSELFSYSEENCRALVEAGRRGRVQPAFLAHPLAPPPEEMRELTLTQLLRFFDNPARFLLESRLEIRLSDDAVPLEEREPFAVEGLAAYDLHQRLLETCLCGESVEDFLAATRCRGLLPPARHGEAVFAGALARVGELVGTIRERIDGNPCLDGFTFDEAIGPFRLSGKLDRIRQGGRISYRCAKLKAKDQIRCWIEHLVLNAFAPSGYPRESSLIMSDGIRSFGEVEHPRELLGELLDRYWDGLRLPLRFFPATSLEYAGGGSPGAVRAKWEGSYTYPGGESENPYFRLCFGREPDPLNEEFQALARQLLGPLVEHRQKEAL